MEHETTTIGPGSLAPVTAATAPTEDREELGRRIGKLLEARAAGQGRAAVLVVEIDSNYAHRARSRVETVLAQWRGKPAGLHPVSLGPGRFVFVIVPVSGQARSVADRFTRALDPRICPLLRRALPYAWSGVGLCPDDGLDAEMLLARAEQALQRMRNAEARRARERRRPSGAVLRPLAAT
jgi:hypothetical protein